MTRPFDREGTKLLGFQLYEMERQASFFMTGGLIAAHSEGRDRGSIWRAMERREVYGTSGPRILLWFDLLNGEGGPAPMGSQVRFDGIPRFQVRAVGSLKQLPGCPQESIEALTSATGRGSSHKGGCSARGRSLILGPAAQPWPDEGSLVRMRPWASSSGR